MNRFENQAFLIYIPKAGAGLILEADGEKALEEMNYSIYIEDLDISVPPTAPGLYVWEGDIVISIYADEPSADVLCRGAFRRAKWEDISRFGIEVEK